MNSIITWEELIRNYALKERNEKLFNILEPISRILKSKAFLYQKGFGFGEIINDKGILNLEKSNHSNDLIAYSNDPLGLVLSKYIEVFIEVSNEEKYTINIPINKIKAGNLIGTFGTLNFLDGIPPVEKSIWSVTGGSRSILMVLPDFGTLGYGKDLLKILRINKILKKNLDDIKYNSYKILRNFKESFKFESKIVFFPSHWFTGEGIEFSKFREYIYREGWKQSSHLRDKMTEHSFYEELIENTYLTDHYKNYIGPFCQALPSILKGEGLLFKPVDLNQESMLYEFQNYLAKEFQKTPNLKKFGIKIFEYDYLNGNYDDWGMISLNTPQLPGHNFATMNKKMRNKKDMIEVLSRKSFEKFSDQNKVKKMLTFLKEDKKSVLNHSFLYQKTNKNVPYSKYSQFFQYLLLDNSHE